MGVADPYAWFKPEERRAELQLRLDQLNAMLSMRRGKPGFSANVIAIEAEIAKVSEEIASGSDGALQDATPLGS